MLPFPLEGNATKLPPLQTSVEKLEMAGFGSTFTVRVNGEPAQPPATPLKGAIVYTITCCMFVVFVSVCDITDCPIFWACCPVSELLFVAIVQVYDELEGTTAPTIELGVKINPASLQIVNT